MKSLSTALALSFYASSSFAGTLEGTVAYRERIALPPQAVFEASLEDVSLADAPSKTLGFARMESPNHSPIQFSIPYDDSQVQPQHRYAVRGKITLGDKLLFTTDRTYPVLTQGNNAELVLQLRAVGNPDKPPKSSEMPASYEGALPCADCPGIGYHLDLFPDHTFFLRMDYQERKQTLDSLGKWTMSGDGRLITLMQNQTVLERFRIKADGSLLKLDAQGQEIDTPMDYSLKRLAAFQAIEPNLKLKGLYSHLADSGYFLECNSGLRLPVATEGDNANLESSYLKVRATPGERLLIEIQGRIAQRPKMEGEGTQAQLVVDQLGRVGQPGDTCDGPQATAQLQETLWQLTHLGEEPIKPYQHRGVPNLVLRREKNRMSGTDGCNRLMGSYELQGEQLHFGKFASTMMACPSPLMATSRSFTEVLAKTKTWKIFGEHLELFDENGKSLARFDSLYLR